MNNNQLLDAAVQLAINYLTDGKHGDEYIFPYGKNHGKGKGGHELQIAIVRREDVLDAIQTRKALETGFLRYDDGVLKVNATSEQAMTFTFGKAMKVKTFMNGKYHRYEDLPKDAANCAGPRARTFEKEVCRELGYHWTGALHHVQFDGWIEETISLEFDKNGNVVRTTRRKRAEMKGKNGRIDAFHASETCED